MVEQAPGVFLRHNLDLNSEWDLPDCGGVEGMCAEPGCALRENQVAARVRSRKRKMAGHLPLVQEEEKEGDHEARTESLILQRGSMRHLADWFYPDGGWGWRVVLAAALIQILVLGPVLGGGQVLSFVSSVRSSNSHPDLLLTHQHHHPTFSDHTGPQHWTFTF